MKYTEYITNMEPKLREKNIELLVNKKFTRDTNREKQFEKFKIVSSKLLLSSVERLLTVSSLSQLVSSISKS